MLRMALRGLLARKLRTALTGFAVVVGVAFVAGTFIYTDTIDASFKDLFERVSKGTDVSVTAKQAVDADFARAQQLDAALLPRVERAEGADAVVGSISADVAIFDREGELIGGNGPPTILVSNVEERFDAFTYAEGRKPEAAGEVTLDQGTAEKQDLEVGDTLRVAAREPAQDFTIVGFTKIGDQSTFGGANLSMILPEVQRITRLQDKLTEIQVAAAGGTTPEALKAQITREVGGEAEVRTGEESASEQAADLSDALGFLKTALLVFAAVAVLVGAFLIFNTFAVTVAQRSKEFALLRTLGASRRQILSSVVAEAMAIGLVASLLGILGGLVLAPALRALMAAFGLELPNTGTVLAPRTIVVALVVGLVATLVSGLVPARRATQVEPMEALRDAVTPGAKRVSRRRLASAIALIVLGLAVLAGGLFGGIASTNAAASLVGLGILVLILGFAVLAPVLVRPLARVVGRPLERIGGLTGRLARENSERQPQRTAITASALMIGLALLVFTAIFAAGLRGSVDKVVDEQFGRSALIVTHDDGFSPVPTGVGERLGSVEGVTTVSPMRFDQAKVRGVTGAPSASGVDPQTITRVFEPEWDRGDQAVLAGMRDDQALADSAWAESNGFALGERLAVTTPAGKRVDYTIAGTYENQVGTLGSFIVTNAAMTRDWNQPDDAFILVGGRGNADTLAGAAKRALDGFPVAKTQTLAEFKDSQAEQVNQLLGLVYALLALSVIVALLGIVNTLALAVHERTRELGLLRAVGMSKRQVRRMVRFESVITALIGAALGMVLGLVLAVVVSRPLADEGFVLTLPWLTLIALGVMAALAGIVAAIPPARRASRVDVLRAVTTE